MSLPDIPKGLEARNGRDIGGGLRIVELTHRPCTEFDPPVTGYGAILFYRGVEIGRKLVSLSPTQSKIEREREIVRCQHELIGSGVTAGLYKLDRQKEDAMLRFINGGVS